MSALIYGAIRGRIAAAKHEAQTLTYLVREGNELALDLYLPKATDNNPLPLLIWFHGGGWVIGSRQDIEKVIIDGAGVFQKPERHIHGDIDGRLFPMLAGFQKQGVLRRIGIAEPPVIAQPLARRVA